MTMLIPKTIVTNLLLLLLLQISNFSTVVFSFQARPKKDYKSEFRVPLGTVVRVVVSNDMLGVKKGYAGFVCTYGPKVWWRTKPGDKFLLIKFAYYSKIRYQFTHCHVRSNRGYVNVPVSISPDASVKCYPSYVCGYSIRKEGVYYKPEDKLYPWQPFPRPPKGRAVQSLIK